MSPDWPPACWVAPDLLDPMMSPMNPCFQLQYLAALPEMHSAGPETKMRDTCRHCWLAKACLLLLFLLCSCRLMVITHPGLLQVHCATFHRHTASFAALPERRMQIERGPTGGAHGGPIRGTLYVPVLLWGYDLHDACIHVSKIIQHLIVFVDLVTQVESGTHVQMNKCGRSCMTKGMSYRQVKTHVTISCPTFSQLASTT